MTLAMFPYYQAGSINYLIIDKTLFFVNAFPCFFRNKSDRKGAATMNGNDGGTWGDGKCFCPRTGVLFSHGGTGGHGGKMKCVFVFPADLM